MTVYVVRVVSSGERVALAGDVVRALEVLRVWARRGAVELVDSRGILLAVAARTRGAAYAAMRVVRRRLASIAEVA